MADIGEIKISVIPDFTGFAKQLRELADKVDPPEMRESRFSPNRAITENFLRDAIGVWTEEHHNGSGGGWTVVWPDGRTNFFHARNLPDPRDWRVLYG